VDNEDTWSLSQSKTSNHRGQKSVLFQHYGLTEHDLERYLAAALSAGGEYADLYFEYLSSTSLMWMSPW